MRRELAPVMTLLVGALIAGVPPLAGFAAAPQFPPPGPHAKIVFGQPTAPPNVVHAPVVV